MMTDADILVLWDQTMDPEDPETPEHKLIVQFARALLSASKPAAPEVDSANFVQRVPDHCDRIVWRGAYYGLPPAAPAQSGEPVAWMLEVPSDSTRWYTSGKQAKDHWVSKGAVATPLYTAPQSSQPVEAGEPEWIAKLRKGLMLSKMTHNFTFSRDEVMALLAAPSAVVLDDERAAFKELRSQMAYIAAYDLNELDGMSKDRLAGRLRSVIDRARKATSDARAASPQSSQPVEAGEPEWIAKLRKGLMLSKMTHNFTFSRDEVMALLAAPSAVVLDDERAAFEKIATKIHYPTCWDTAAYPTLASALAECAEWYDMRCGECLDGSVARAASPKVGK